MSTQGNRRALGPGYSREILPRPPAQSHDQSRFQAAPSAARKANVSLACATCRKLKVKCDGCTPCSTCVSRNIGDSCTYETDNRRKGILKEKLRDSQQEISHLQRILHRLRFTDDTAATFLLGQIRSGLTVEELIKHIDTTVAVGGSSTPERNTLIKDSRLKRRLVGLYFEWQHPYVPIFSGQEVPDLPGPEDNRTSELLISPVIEAIMAIGSWYHDYTETTNIPGIDMEELRVLLVEEADRLLTADNNSRGSELDPVATIQASIILVTRDLAAGESETAWSRLGTAVLTAISLAWEVDASHEVNANADRSRATYWALYLTDRLVALMLRRLPRLRPRCHPRKPAESYWQGRSSFHPSPSAASTTGLAYTAELFSLFEIIDEIQMTLHLPKLWWNAEQISLLQLRLLQWKAASQPVEMGPGAYASPPFFNLRLLYYVAHLSLFRSIPVMPPYAALPTPKDAAVAVLHLVSVYDRCYGLRYAPVYYVSYLTEAVKVLIAETASDPPFVIPLFSQYIQYIKGLAEPYKSPVEHALLSVLSLLLAQETAVRLPNHVYHDLADVISLEPFAQLFSASTNPADFTDFTSTSTLAFNSHVFAQTASSVEFNDLFRE